MIIDIAMTAALRPDILAQTLHSINENLRWRDGFRLIIDIAPVGDSQFTQDDVEQVAYSFFPDSIVRKLPVSHQAEALKWSWRAAESKYIFQWEDDWILRSSVDVSRILDFAQQDFNCAMIYLDRFKKPVCSYPGYSGAFRYLRDGFWERLKGKSLGGPPALLSKRYADAVCDMITGYDCLDTLSHKESVRHFLSQWNIYVYTGNQRDGLVEDIGKQWKLDRGLIRTKRSSVGVKWISK
jgi:hypothetical protein